MVDMYRIGKEFSFDEKEAKREAVGHHCEGCNREIYSRRDKAHPHELMLEIHHLDPIENGGGRDSVLVALCGPRGCHEITDRLTKFRGVFFDEVVEKLGQHPYERYVDSIERRDVKSIKKVTDHVAQRLRRACRAQ